MNKDQDGHQKTFKKNFSPPEASAWDQTWISWEIKSDDGKSCEPVTLTKINLASLSL